MNDDQHLHYELLSHLLNGCYPESMSDTDPQLLAKVLVEAIAWHEQRIRESKDEADSLESYADLVSDLIAEGFEEPDEENMLWIDVAGKEAEQFREKTQSARDMLETCESMLLDLLDKHPELKDQL